MAYKWKPSKSQRKEFAQKMATDSDFAEQYNDRKAAQADKRRAGSKFDYNSAGGEYVPTEVQHDAAMKALASLQLTESQRNACELVASAYLMQDKTHHDHIHIVNELRRENSCLG